MTKKAVVEKKSSAGGKWLGVNALGERAAEPFHVELFFDAPCGVPVLESEMIPFRLRRGAREAEKGLAGAGWGVARQLNPAVEVKNEGGTAK